MWLFRFALCWTNNIRQAHWNKEMALLAEAIAGPDAAEWQNSTS